MYQLSRIQNKPWYVSSKERLSGFCKVCVLFHQKLESKPRSKSFKTEYQDDGKSEKITKHEAIEYRKDALEKANEFLESYRDSTTSVTHYKNSDEKYERNIHIIKIIIRAVLLCAD